MVALLPYVTSGNTGAVEALRRGPAFVRSTRLGPHGATYWHRPRSGRRYPGGHVCWSAWCGQAVSSRYCVTTSRPPRRAPVCATCDGRAAGAGQIPATTVYPTKFSPRYTLDPPALCPGGRPGHNAENLYAPIAGTWRVGTCLVCGQVEALRASGGPYRGYVALARHAPGPALVQPCEFHAWLRMVARDGVAVCACSTGERWAI